MKTLVLKEIRQLLPVFIASLLLAALPLWINLAWLHLSYDRNFDDSWMMCPVIFGVLVMALSCFGREYGMNTFPLLLALPLERSRIWWSKIVVLACAMAAAYCTWFASYAVWCYLNPGWRHPMNQAAIALVFVVIFSSGIWTTLLLRQVIAAFWFAVLIPTSILMLIIWNGGNDLTVEIALGIYSVAGFWLARRLFYRAQEVAWTGGEVTLPELRLAGAATRSASRNFRPIAALIWKELKLYQVALAGMAALFLVHLGVIALRKVLQNRYDFENTTFSTALQMFGGLWLLVPLVTGSLNVADERRMGTLDGQLCQPVSSRVQFFVKLVIELLISGFLSWLLLSLAEFIGYYLHAGTGFMKASPDDVEVFSVLPVVLILSLLVFYASTMTKSPLQAMAVSIFIVILAFAVGAFAAAIQWASDFIFWTPPLFFLIWLPIIVLTLIGMGYRNFRRLTEVRRLWFRNTRALAAATILASIIALLVFHRAWELITPLEPPHGPSQLTMTQVRKVRFVNWSYASVSFSDGRLWRKRFEFIPPPLFKPFAEELFFSLGRGKWLTQTGSGFLPGTNWVAETHNGWEDVGIRGDGSLWVSEKPVRPFRSVNKKLVTEPPAPMVRYGVESDWKSVVRDENSITLLKTDGTLWRWGTNHTGLAHATIYRLGTDSDWSRILTSSVGIFIWKNDGRAWRFSKPGNDKLISRIILAPDLTLERWQNFDNISLRNIAWGLWYALSVRDDGTLWTYGAPDNPAFGGGTQKQPTKAVQVGTDSDWISVAGDSFLFVGLKRDGTLWKWEIQQSWYWYNHKQYETRPFSKPPVRLGANSDWVGLSGTDVVCSLAGDGSLWNWSASEYSVWTVPTRRPTELANIFSQP